MITITFKVNETPLWCNSAITNAITDVIRAIRDYGQGQYRIELTDGTKTESCEINDNSGEDEANDLIRAWDVSVYPELWESKTE